MESKEIEMKPEIVNNNEHADVFVDPHQETICSDSKTSNQLENPTEPNQQSVKSCIDKPFPIIGFLKRYKREDFRYDLVSGLTVGIIAIPQGMANSMMANLPPAYGLYGGIMPVLFHSICTTSRQLHVGPYAVASLLCASFLSFIDYETNLTEYVTAMVTLAFLSGTVLIILSLFRLGFISRILSDSVVTAFTAASAIQITTSQLGGFWGVSTGTGSVLQQVIRLFSLSTIQAYNWYSFIIGISSSILLYASKRLNQKYCPSIPLPLELFLVILFVFLSWGFDLKNNWNLRIIGDYDIVKGFPPISLPSQKYMLRLLPSCLIIAIITFSTNISLGKSFARQFQYHMDDNQELLALGMCQVGGSFFSSLPCSASISRSSVVAGIGGKTPVFSLLSPLVVLFCLFVLMDWVSYLPNAVLVTVVVINLFGVLKKFSIIPKLYRSSRPDFWSFCICTTVLVLFGAEVGLLVGVVASLLLLWITLKTTPNKAIENKLDNIVINGGRFLHFLNRDNLVDKIEKELHSNKENDICVNLTAIQFIDMSGMNALQDITKMIKSSDRNYQLLVCGDYIKTKMDSFDTTSILFTDTTVHVVYICLLNTIILWYIRF